MVAQRPLVHEGPPSLDDLIKPPLNLLALDGLYYGPFSGHRPCMIVRLIKKSMSSSTNVQRFFWKRKQNLFVEPTEILVVKGMKTVRRLFYGLFKLKKSELHKKKPFLLKIYSNAR